MKNVEKSKANKQGSRFHEYSELIADVDGNYTKKKDFVDHLMPIATKVGKKVGLDPLLLVGIAVYETGWGSKVKGHNYFGIKGTGQTFTTHEEQDGLMVKQKDSFRKYDTLEDSVEGFSRFVTENPRYKAMLEAETLDEQIDKLGGSGYATDSRYADKIRRIVKGETLQELLG